MSELSLGDPVGLQGVDDLDEELVEFLAGNRADFEMIKAFDEKFGDFIRDGGFSNIESLVDVKTENFFHNLPHFITANLFFPFFKRAG